MIDLGDVATLRVLITDDNGNLANATTVTLSITKPDGTAATVTNPVVASPTGTYTYTFTPTEPGRHTVRWVATGTNASAYTDAFDVDEAAPSGIVSLADARDRLNFTSTVSDEELRFYIDAATDYVEGIIGPVVRRTVVETATPGRDGIPLSHSPVISITSVAGAYGYSATYDVATLYVTDAGILRPTYGGTLTGPLTVTYVAGYASVPALIREAALDYVKWAWESQRGASGAPFGGEEFADQATPTPPYKIGEELRRYQPAVVA